MSEVRLLGLFFAEFDNVLGPRVVLQTPDECVVVLLDRAGDVFSSNQFDAVSEFVIAKPCLCNRLVSVPLPPRGVVESNVRSDAQCVDGTAERWVPGEEDLRLDADLQSAAGLSSSRTHLLGIPISIEHHRYARNAFLFNVGFVLECQGSGSLRWDAAPVDEDVEGLSPDSQHAYVFLWSHGNALRKLGHALAELETDGQWLSDPSKRTVVARCLEQVRLQLQDRGESFATLPSGAYLALQLRSPLVPWSPTARRSTPSVEPHHVPVPVRDTGALVGHDWDLGLRRILAYMDGRTHLRDIAEAADMALPLAIAAVRMLVQLGFVVLVDVFQFGNEYRVTRRAQQLVRKESLARAAMHLFAHEAMLTPKGDVTSDGGNILHRTTVQQNARLLLRLYAAFGPGKSVQSVIHSFPEAFGVGVPEEESGGDRGGGGGGMGKKTATQVHPRALVTFGVMHGLLERVHQFVVPLEGDEGDDDNDNGNHTSSGNDGGGEREMDRGTTSFSVSESTPVAVEISTKLQWFLDQFAPWLEGDQCLDAICCASRMSAREVRRLLHVSRSPAFRIVRR